MYVAGVDGVCTRIAFLPFFTTRATLYFNFRYKPTYAGGLKARNETCWDSLGSCGVLRLCRHHAERCCEHRRNSRGQDLMGYVSGHSTPPSLLLICALNPKKTHPNQRNVGTAALPAVQPLVFRIPITLLSLFLHHFSLILILLISTHLMMVRVTAVKSQLHHQLRPFSWQPRPSLTTKGTDGR